VGNVRRSLCGRARARRPSSRPRKAPRRRHGRRQPTPRIRAGSSVVLSSAPSSVQPSSFSPTAIPPTGRSTAPRLLTTNIRALLARQRRRSGRARPGNARQSRLDASCGARRWDWQGPSSLPSLPVCSPSSPMSSGTTRDRRPKQRSTNAIAQCRRHVRHNFRNRLRWASSHNKRVRQGISQRRCCWRWRRCRTRGLATGFWTSPVPCLTRRPPRCIRHGCGTGRRRRLATPARSKAHPSAPTGRMW